MSETLADAAKHVRELMRDTDAAQYAVYTYTELYRTLVSQGQTLAEKAGVGRTWVSGAFSSFAGSLDDISLPTSVQYHAIYDVKNATQGTMLLRYSLAEINSMR